MRAIRKAWPLGVIAIVTVLVVEAAVFGALVLSPQSESMSGVAVRASDAQLLVTDQRDVVRSIKVDRVVAPANGWLVVQADAGDGVPGAIIGSVPVQSGATSDITIPLDPLQQIPKRAFVTLLADLGQPKVLEYSVSGASGMSKASDMGSAPSTAGLIGQAASKDKPIIAGGMLVVAQVNITPLTFAVEAGRASIASASIPATSSTVTLHAVRAPAASWAVVSTEGTGGVPGTVLGQSQVPPGVYTRVPVELPGLAGKTKLRASLHVDLGTPGAFEFTSPDAATSPDQPYLAGGESVSVPVVVTRH